MLGQLLRVQLKGYSLLLYSEHRIVEMLALTTRRPTQSKDLGAGLIGMAKGKRN